MGYEGSDTAFTQLVSSMAKSGSLIREVRGKRTYRLSVANAAQSPEAPPVKEEPETLPGLMDYDELAAALLARVTRILSAPSDGSDSASWAKRRLDQLETRNSALQRDAARAKAELDTVVAERDALRTQLEAAQHNITILTERLNTPRNPQSRAAERLGSDEQTLLYQLRGRSRPGASSPERVG